MLNMFRMLIHPSSGACNLFFELVHGLYCSGTVCVGVTLWFGWGGVVSGCRLRQQCFFISLFHAQRVSDVKTSILRILRLICWVISWVVLFWYDACWCYGVVWLGWCGVVYGCTLKCFNYQDDARSNKHKTWYKVLAAHAMRVNRGSRDRGLPVLISVSDGVQ